MQQNSNSPLCTVVVRIATIVFIVLSGSACQSELVTRVVESGVVTGIRNLPATVLPGQFASTAYVDRNFSIANAAVAPDGAFAIIPTLFATNRTFQSTTSDPYGMFADTRGDQLTLGSAYVRIPRSGDTFDIEPDNLTRIALAEQPLVPSALLENQVLDREEFSNRARTATSRAGDDVLLYVHGYNVDFVDAAIHTAQFSYDIGFSGLTYFYSWPARGDVATYVADVESLHASRRYLQEMLNLLLYTTPAANIYLVAHDTGAHLLARSLRDVIATQPVVRSRIREIILVVPDIGVTEFKRELAPALGSEDSPITVYASDSAVLDLPRSVSTDALVGDTRNGIVIANGIETVDASGLKTTFDSHSSYSDRRTVVSDIWNLVQFGSRASFRRDLTTVYAPQGTYWRFRPPAEQSAR